MRLHGGIATALLVVLTALVALNLGGLWAVSQRLASLSEEQARLAGRPQASAAGAEDLRTLQDRLARAEGDRAKAAADLAAATEGLTKASADTAKLTQDLAALQARVKAIEDRPQALERKAPVALAPNELGYIKPWVERMKENPALAPQTLLRAFNLKSAAGVGHALGLDEAGQARLQQAYDQVLAKLRAAEKAHAKVSLQGEAVRIHLEPFPQQGQALRKEWQDALAGLLAAQQLDLYKQGRGDSVLFDRGFGDSVLTLTVTRQGNMLTIQRRAQGINGQGASHSTMTIAGEGALEAFPDRHLLTDDALAKLREK